MIACKTAHGLSQLADAFDLFLIDQFGVLHDGARPYGGAVACLAELKARGKRVVLLSNSGKRATPNIARLDQLGFARALFDDVVTSGEVAWHGIADGTFGAPFLPGSKILLLGHDEHDYGFEQIGLQSIDDPAGADFVMIVASRVPDVPLTHYRGLLAAAAARGIPALCCNPDRLMLTARGLQPSAGEIVALYAELGGKVCFVGKPYPDMYDFARQQNPRHAAARTLAIGDSIEHDVAGGRQAGIATALVRTGLCAGIGDSALGTSIACHGAWPEFVLPALRWQ
jgi:HAD superfamily hydrolase (TIGR01459 family)